MSLSLSEMGEEGLGYVLHGDTDNSFFFMIANE